MTVKTTGIACLSTFLIAAACATAQADWPTSGVRQERKFSVMGQTSWNGLTGSGLMLALNPIPFLSLDFGVGGGAIGLKSGLRLRANLLPGKVTPFVGGGYFFGSGTGTGTIEGEDEGNEIKFRRTRCTDRRLVFLSSGCDCYCDGNSKRVARASEGMAS